MKSSTKIYVLTVVLWLIGCVGYSVRKLSNYTPNPLDGDFYAHNWGYHNLHRDGDLETMQTIVRIGPDPDPEGAGRVIAYDWHDLSDERRWDD